MDDIDHLDDDTNSERLPDGQDQEPAIQPLVLGKNSFGTAMGAAMLGFEQALRREPPAQILAAEHMPERDHSGDGRGFVIEFPEDDRATSGETSDQDRD